MELKGHLRVIFLLGVACLANGFIDNPEGPACANLVPYYELEKPSQSFDTPFFLEKWNEPDLQFLTTFSPSSRSGLNRRKRSADNDRKESESSGQRNIMKIPYIHPLQLRLGKRSDLDLEDMLDEERFHELDMYGNEFTSRLGRSEESNTIQLKAGPEGIIQVNPAFTPRLGRSEKIPLFAASAFTPRLGRSEGQQKIYLNAGSAFTPRLGRADDQNTKPIKIKPTPSFQPRLGRSGGINKITLRTENTDTPQTGRQIITWNPKNTPRLG